MNFDEYRAVDAVNWSTLKALRTSPRHYQHALLREDKTDSVPRRLGRALHTLILEPLQFEERHPEFTGKVRRGKGWEEFLNEHPDADPLTQEELGRVYRMADAIRSNEFALSHLVEGVTEKTLQWKDPDTGIDCKGRCDSVNGHLVELKTCNGKDFPPARFQNHAARLLYHGQVAYYADGLVATGYKVDDHPAMIVAESESPFDVAVYALKPEFIEYGRTVYKRLLWKLAECQRLSRWPGVGSEKELSLGLPAWAELEAL